MILYQFRWHPYCKNLVETRFIASLYNAVATVHEISTTVLPDMILQQFSIE
jgi:hypothetical protein